MNNQKIKKRIFSKESFLVKNKQFFIAILGWIIFLVTFFWLKENIAPKYFIYSPLDDYIPFVKWFFPVYCSWYLYMAAPLFYFCFFSRQDFMKLQYYLFTGFFICLTFYAIHPNGIDFRPVVTETDLISTVMSAMYTLDSSTVVTPSMHVFASVAIHLGLTQSEKTKNKKGLLICSFILMALICASTVLVKQHSIIDVFWGIVLALLLFVPFYVIKRQPRSNKQDS